MASKVCDRHKCMKCFCNSKVKKILDISYPVVSILGDFLQAIHAPFSQLKDFRGSRFAKLLTTVIICVPANAPQLRATFSTTCNYCIKEILAILDTTRAWRQHDCPIESLFAWLWSDSWQQLHQQVGDEVIIYLLSQCSLYLFVSSCAVQICGKPPDICLTVKNLIVTSPEQRKRHAENSEASSRKMKIMYQPSNDTEYFSIPDFFNDNKHSQTANDNPGFAQQSEHQFHTCSSSVGLEFPPSTDKFAECGDAKIMSQTSYDTEYFSLPYFLNDQNPLQTANDNPGFTQISENQFHSCQSSVSLEFQKLTENFAECVDAKMTKPCQSPSNNSNSPLSEYFSCTGSPQENQVARKVHKSSRRGKKSKRPNSYHLILTPMDSFHQTARKRIILYSKVWREGLPKSHILQRKYPVETVATGVAKEILLPNCQQNVNEFALKSVASPLMSSVMLLISQHRKCRYIMLLNHHCPLQQSGPMQGDKRIPEKCEDLTWLLKQRTPKHQVYLFLRSALYHVVPNSLWGCKSNETNFLKFLKNFVDGGKHYQCTFDDLKRDMRFDLELQNGYRNKRVAHEAYSKLLWWLFSKWLLPMIKAYFYATETTFQQYKVVYYRKAVWKEIHNYSVSKYTIGSAKIWHSISKDRLPEVLGYKMNSSLPQIRFIPKKKGGARPIANTNHKGDASQKSLTINQKLTPLLLVFNNMLQMQPNIFGCSKVNMDKVGETLADFIARKNFAGRKEKMYCVKIDMTDAYSTINLAKLFDIVCGRMKQFCEKLESEVFICRRYCKVYRCSNGQLRRVFYGKAHCGDPAALDNRVSIDLGNIHDAVVFLQASRTRQYSLKYLIDMLRQYLFKNVVQIGQDLYGQTKGLLQGSSLSVHLFNMYYAHLEESNSHWDRRMEMLVRMLDDWLLLTPSLCHAKEFVMIMTSERMAREYNVLINKEKFNCNFTCYHLPSIPAMQQPLITWCGFQINLADLNVSLDYSRYRSVSNTVMFDASRKPGEVLRNKLVDTIRLKSYPVLFDKRVNGDGRIFINIQEMFLLTAFKFLACVPQLPGKIDKNVNFLAEVILNLPAFMYSTIICKLKQSPKIVEIKWLCWQSFLMVLGRHQGQYKSIIKIVLNRQREVERRLPSQSAQFLRERAQGSILENLSK